MGDVDPVVRVVAEPIENLGEATGESIAKPAHVAGFLVKTAGIFAKGGASSVRTNHDIVE